METKLTRPEDMIYPESNLDILINLIEEQFKKNRKLNNYDFRCYNMIIIISTQYSDVSADDRGKIEETYENVGWNKVIVSIGPQSRTQIMFNCKK